MYIICTYRDFRLLLYSFMIKSLLLFITFIGSKSADVQFMSNLSSQMLTVLTVSSMHTHVDPQL